MVESSFGRLSSLKAAASKAHIVPAATSVPIDFNLSFTLPTRLREDGAVAVEREFHVGCYGEATKGKDEICQLTYSVLIGAHGPPSKYVARKFHFDFEPVAARNLAEPKPTFHLQMCGKLSGHHEDAGYAPGDIAHLLPAWSQPRIPAQPMSLALVLNWLFIEFGRDASISAARTSPTWRKQVRAAERTILGPYFQSCADFLSQQANADESFYAKKIYEEH